MSGAVQRTTPDARGNDNRRCVRHDAHMDSTANTSTTSLGDGRLLTLPAGWDPVEESMFATALAQTEDAFTRGGPGVEHAVEALLQYYDPAGKFSGATFLDVENYDDFAITAGDLWAVSTLSMKVPPEAGRALMNPGTLKTIVVSHLRQLPTTLGLPDVTATDLEHMRALYEGVRSMLPPLGRGPETNQWVLSSKICARKRPLLFPVRDSKVCTYLSGNKRMGGKPGQLGSFRRDIQVLAYLITHPVVREKLATVRVQLNAQQPSWSFDWSDLRLLDTTLWTHATN
jgi:hypothetical protein